MHIICDKLTLLEAINGVSKAVTHRSNVPVLEGILFKIANNTVSLTGYDLEMGITTTISCTVQQEGDIVISAKLLGDITRKMEGETVEIISDENLLVTVKSGITEFNIVGMPAVDFPELPSPGADQLITIEAAILKQMIDSTLYAVSVDDKKPAHTGELIDIKEGKITLVALDGYRLAICEREVKAEQEISIIVPQKTMSEISRLIGDSTDMVEIFANRRYIICNIASYTILSRLIEGEFLDYTKVVPEGFTTKVKVKTKDFINSVERASLIIIERLRSPLRINFDEKVTVKCQTTLGKVSDEFSAEIEGDEIEIGFNNRYLLDALKYANREEVIIELSGPLSPVKVLPVEGSDFLFLVLPVRFKND
jgi:DNA polymerase III, beta subunit